MKYLLLLCIGVAACLNCKTDLLRACVDCFRQQGLPTAFLTFFTVQNADMGSALTLTLFNPGLQCRQPEKYKMAAVCMVNNMSLCLPPIRVAILPDTELMKQGMDRLCDQYPYAKAECLTKVYYRLSLCTDANMRALFEQNPSFVVKDVACRAKDITYDCMYHVLQGRCGRYTMTAYLEMVRFYFIPRNCTHIDPARADRRIYYTTPATMNSAMATRTQKRPLFILLLMSFTSYSLFQNVIIVFI